MTVAWEVLVPVSDGRPELMLFGAPWCPSCETLKPRLIEWCLAQGVALLYYNVDNEANKQLGQSYGFRLIPAVVGWTGGPEPAYRAAGSFISFERMHDALRPPSSGG